MPFDLGTNTLKSIDIFAGRNFGPGPRNYWSVAAFGASGGAPTWTHRGVYDMAGSNRSQDILPHTACGSSAAGARGRYPLGARHRAHSGRGTRPVPIPSSQRPLTRA